MTNGNKRDKTNNKSTISTPTRKEVQRRRKDGSNDTTDVEIDGQVRTIDNPSLASQDPNGRQEKQATLTQSVMGAEKKVLLPKSFFAGSKIIELLLLVDLDAIAIELDELICVRASDATSGAPSQAP